MKVAVLANAFPPARGGGVMTSHTNLLKLLAGAGLDARGFSFLDNSMSSAGQPVTRRGLPGPLEKLVTIGARLGFRLADRGAIAYQFADALAGAVGALRLSRPLSGFRPDAVVAPDHGAPMAFLNPPAGARTIVVAHHNPMRFLDLPLIGRHSRRDARLALSLERRAVARADHVVCPSAYMAAVFRETFGDTTPVSVIPNLIDGNWLSTIPAHDIRARLELPPEAPLIYIPSAGSKLKGGRYVYEIVRRLAGAADGPIGFFLSGALGGELRYELGRVPANARIFAPGHLDAAANVGCVRACSFVVSPTLVENFSMALLEAIHLGLPVATFAVGGNPEIVRDGENGYLAAEGDVEGLVAAARRMLDPQILEGLHVSTPATAERFAPSHWLDAWLKVLKP